MELKPKMAPSAPPKAPLVFSVYFMDCDCQTDQTDHCMGASQENVPKDLCRCHTKRKMGGLVPCHSLFECDTDYKIVLCCLQSCVKGKHALRVLARYEAQNRPLFYISFDIFINTLSFKNLNVHILTKGP